MLKKTMRPPYLGFLTAYSAQENGINICSRQLTIPKRAEKNVRPKFDLSKFLFNQDGFAPCYRLDYKPAWNSNAFLRPSYHSRTSAGFIQRMGIKQRRTPNSLSFIWEYTFEENTDRANTIHVSQGTPELTYAGILAAAGTLIAAQAQCLILS